MRTANLTRREWLRATGAIGIAAAGYASAAGLSNHSERPESLLPEADLAWLRDLTTRLLETGKSAVRIEKDTFPVYLPSGSNQYPAFWARDAVWIIHSELVPSEEIGSMVRVLALSQNGPEDRELAHSLRVPKWTIADHVLRDGGGAVYFPGTYSAGHDQGTGRYGRVAAQDASYQFVEMAYEWVKQSGNPAVLQEKINGLSILERMKLAFDSPEHDPDTQLAHTTEEARAVAFSDAIVKTGFLLEGSVLRWRAARRLSLICAQLGEAKQEQQYSAIASRIRENLVPTFWVGDSQGEHGWLVSATGVGRKDCVRGTSFALAFGAVPEPHATGASRALAEASTPPRYDAKPSKGQITFRAHVRHLKAGEYWDETPMPEEHYQNGGYWSMFTGWYVRGLANQELAKQTAQLFLKHLRRHNFHDGTQTPQGAPWEWIHPSGRQHGPKYLAGLTLPYRGFKSTFDQGDTAR